MSLQKSVEWLAEAVSKSVARSALCAGACISTAAHTIRHTRRTGIVTRVVVARCAVVESCARIIHEGLRGTANTLARTKCE